MARDAILYDRDCAFCTWCTAKVLAWDRRDRLRPVALQDPEAVRLLPDMDEERRMASWHLVSADGRVRSAGAALAPLLRMLPGGAPLATLAAAFPRLTESAYRLVARNRGRFGRLVPQSAVLRARGRIERRRR
jgi:predicted DCC family thiol-disulfide oxidoreductase YuxK